MKTATSRRRLSLAALLAVLALTFAACGSDGGDDADATTTTEASGGDQTTTTAADDDTTTTESGDDTTTTGSDDDTTTTEGSGSGGGMNEMVRDQIVTQYKGMGMTQEQAECGADFIIDSMGDSGDMSGLMEMGQEMFSKCDIDPTDLQMPSSGN